MICRAASTGVSFCLVVGLLAPPTTAAPEVDHDRATWLDIYGDALAIGPVGSGQSSNGIYLSGGACDIADIDDCAGKESLLPAVVGVPSSIRSGSWPVQ